MIFNINSSLKEENYSKDIFNNALAFKQMLIEIELEYQACVNTVPFHSSWPEIQAGQWKYSRV